MRSFDPGTYLGFLKKETFPRSFVCLLSTLEVSPGDDLFLDIRDLHRPNVEKRKMGSPTKADDFRRTFVIFPKGHAACFFWDGSC